MSMFETLTARANDGSSWVRNPYAGEAFAAHEQVEKDFLEPAISNGDFAARAIWVTLDAVFVNPMIAMASLVEALFRTFVGLLALGISLIPFEENQDLRAIGKGMMQSVLQCGKVLGLSLWNIVKVPSIVVGKTTKVFWSTSCCSKDFEASEVESVVDEGESDPEDFPSPVMPAKPEGTKTGHRK